MSKKKNCFVIKCMGDSTCQNIVFAMGRCSKHYDQFMNNPLNYAPSNDICDMSGNLISLDHLNYTNNDQRNERTEARSM